MLARIGRKRFNVYPDLHFELTTILWGVDTITLYYKGHRGFSAEVFFLDENRMVFKSFAHYATF